MGFWLQSLEWPQNRRADILPIGIHFTHPWQAHSERSALCICPLTFAVPSPVMAAPLFLLLKVMPVSVPVFVPAPFPHPEEVVVPPQGRTLHTHPTSVPVSLPAGARLQPHRAQTLQPRPVVLRHGQRVQRPVGQQPGASLGATGSQAAVPSVAPAGAVAL